MISLFFTVRIVNADYVNFAVKFQRLVSVVGERKFFYRVFLFTISINHIMEACDSLDIREFGLQCPS